MICVIAFLSFSEVMRSSNAKTISKKPSTNIERASCLSTHLVSQYFFNTENGLFSNFVFNI